MRDKFGHNVFSCAQLGYRRNPGWAKLGVKTWGMNNLRAIEGEIESW